MSDGMKCPHGHPSMLVLHHESGEQCPWPDEMADGVPMGVVVIRPVMRADTIQVEVSVDGLGTAETVGFMEIAKQQYLDNKAHGEVQ